MAALCRAARLATKPLEAGPLAASASIGHLIGEARAKLLCEELAHSGELIKDRIQNPRALWEVIEVYSAPGARR